VHADLDTLVIALYVSIDELIGSRNGPRRSPGRPPKLSDAELLCLAVAQVLLGFASERRWLRFAHARLGHLFPRLLTASAYNRRLRRARPLLCLTIRDLAMRTPSWADQLRLIDSTAVACAASRETVKRSELAGWAAYGYCKSHHRYFWGLRLYVRLYVLAAPDGLPVACRWPGAWPAPSVVSGRSWLSCWRPNATGCARGCWWSPARALPAASWSGSSPAMAPGCCGLTARTSHAGSGRWAGSVSGSRVCLTRSKISSAWSATAAGLTQGWWSVSPSACSP
jgi:hypothetical protein